MRPAAQRTPNGRAIRALRAVVGGASSARMTVDADHRPAYQDELANYRDESARRRLDPRAF